MEDKFKFDRDIGFVVKESALLNYLVAGISIALFIGVLITRNFEIGEAPSDFYFIYVFVLLPGIMSLVRYSRKKAIIKICTAGVFYYGVPVTDWNNFRNAFIGEEYPNVTSNSSGLSDKFSVMVTFFNSTDNRDYLYKMALSNSQDKSPEQIISAIEFYSGMTLSFEVIAI